MRSLLRLMMAVACAAAVALPVAAQQPDVRVDEDQITIRGCVGPADPTQPFDQSMLVWTRGDIMLVHAAAVGGDPRAVGTTGVPGPFFYWLDDDEDLSRHVGQQIEITGELGDFEEGQVKISRDNGFTEIEIELDGDTEKARVPSSWLAPGADQDAEFDIVTRKIDVEDIRVLGACPVR